MGSPRGLPTIDRKKLIDQFKKYGGAESGFWLSPSQKSPTDSLSKVIC